MEGDSRVKLVQNSLVAYQNFPKPGITFQDIFSGVFLKPEALEALMQMMEEKAKSLKGMCTKYVLTFFSCSFFPQLCSTAVFS